MIIIVVVGVAVGEYERESTLYVTNINEEFKRHRRCGDR